MNTRILMTIALLVFITNTIADAQWRSKRTMFIMPLQGLTLRLMVNLTNGRVSWKPSQVPMENRFVALNTLEMCLKHTTVENGKGRMTTRPVS